MFWKSREYNSTDNDIQILNEDSFSLKTELKYKPYDIYLYDGDHSIESHEKAITEYFDYLAKYSIIIIDDWCWEQVRTGTFDGFQKVHNNIKNMYKVELIKDLGNTGYWNGCCIFLIEKNE